jgi:hypothetical protein
MLGLIPRVIESDLSRNRLPVLVQSLISGVYGAALISSSTNVSGSTHYYVPGSYD